MDSAPSMKDFDYTVFDSSGIKGVKDGKEYPISKEEWDKAHPEHKNIECAECSFVQDKETLLTFIISRELKEQAGSIPKFVGKFSMPGWVGHSSFYVFRCQECKSITVDYPHGYRGDCMFVRCGDCSYEIVLNPRKFRAIYKRDNLHVPREITWKEKRKKLKLLKEQMIKVEDLGVVPLVRPSSIENTMTLIQKIKLFLGLKS
jgi:hypothetical protein